MAKTTNKVTPSQSYTQAKSRSSKINVLDHSLRMGEKKQMAVKRTPVKMKEDMHLKIDLER